MKNNIYKIIFMLLLLVSFNLNASDNNLLTSYRINFTRSNIENKAKIIKTARAIKDKNFNLLFVDALNYVDNSYNLLKNDPLLLEIAIDSVNQLTEEHYTNAALKIRYLFSKIHSEKFHIACLNAFRTFQFKEDNLLERLNSICNLLFINKQNGKDISMVLLQTYIKTLGVIGNSESFNILFYNLVKTKEQNLTIATKEALNSINCDFIAQINSIIEKKNIYYTMTAFDVVKSKHDLSIETLGAITELVFTQGLTNIKKQPTISKKLISECLKVIANIKWTNALPLVIDYFYQIQSDYKAGLNMIDELIIVINCMGELKSIDSANSLAVFLGILNSEVERNKRYDEDVVLAVIEALGNLGHKSAFDYLLNIDYLNYSKTVKQSARNAISRLKW